MSDENRMNGWAFLNENFWLVVIMVIALTCCGARKGPGCTFELAPATPAAIDAGAP